MKVSRLSMQAPLLECAVTRNRNGVIVPTVSCIEKTVNAGGVCPRKTDKQSSGSGIGDASDQVGDSCDSEQCTAPVNGKNIVAGARTQSIH